jgi:DNA-binding ferritin-like protein
VKFIARSEDSCLFSSDDYGVIINETTKEVVSTGAYGTIVASAEWSTSKTVPSQALFDLASAAVTDLDIKVFSNNDRMYTIPKSAQNEAQRALDWHKEHKRGGTPVGMNTARTLARGGQIGIAKVRHIAKYFPRHEVDKRGKGYKPGEDGYPSNGRIAWALWGGDAGQRWASAIVERENKKASNASLYEEVLPIDLSYFSSDDSQFSIRVNADGSGIDRLYMTDSDGFVSVWDDGSWSDLGQKSKHFSLIDSFIDESSSVEKIYFPVDSDAALLASALLDGSPFLATSIENINVEEASMVAAAMDEIDWGYIDALTFADEATTDNKKTDGKYTEEERSKNASSQVRDATGKFAKMGSRVTISGNQAASGTVEKINSDNQTVTVKLDNGSSVDVPANLTEASEDAPSEPSSGTALGGPRFGQPLDVSGILGEPRDSANPVLAGLPNRLPPLTSDDIQTMLTDWPAWVADQRSAYNATRQEVPSVKVNTDAEDRKAPNAYNDPYLRNWLDAKYSNKGKTSYPNRSWYNPMRTDDIQAKKSAKEVGTRGPASSGVGGRSSSSSWSRSTDKNGVVTTTRRSSSSVTAAGELKALSPETSDVPPIYMAIVAEDDPQAVMDLVCLIPKNNQSTTPTTFSRKDGKWVKDEGVLSDLNSSTPPPVVVLDDNSLDSVLTQIEGEKTAPVTASIDSVLSLLWDSSGELLAITSAGGLDKNKGNAEKLRRYWTVGEGGAKIRWGTGGDWTRCVRLLSKYMGPRAKGYCALRHKEMTGLWTGDKAHRQLYGKKGAFSVYSDELIRSTSEIVSNAELSAQANDARMRIVASAGAPVEEGSKFYMPLVLPEDVESGDGRKFSKGAISMRELPLPLMWQIRTAQGHDGSVVVGRIDKMERTDEGVGNAYGVFDSGEYGKEAERLVRGGFISGISADLDRFEADEEEAAADDEKKIGSGKIKVTKGRIMGVTLVPKPAFQECKILLVDNVNNSQEENVLPDGEYVEEPAEQDSAALVACAAVVASIPVTPPKAWFENPRLDGPTPLTVTDDGKVFGHIAAWHVDHIGMSFGTKPPRSKSKYSYFHTGVVRTEEGSDIPVGQLTLAGGHASLEASARAAAKHYDDTASAFADVHAGEDAHGIWVAGALRPSITPEQVRAIRASAPSGDWRPIRGSLELVAVCQVNVPGFPIARARVASGSVMALVAAGAQVLARMKADPMAELAARIERLEQVEMEPILAAAEDARARFAALKSEFIISEESITAGAGCGCCANCTSMCDGSCCANCMMSAPSYGSTDIVEPLSVEVLEKLMSDIVSFYFRAHGYHWNVKGSDFSQYHELFGEIYEDVYGSIDPLAENIRKMGFDAPFNLGEFMQLRSIQDSTVTLDSPISLAYDLSEANDILIDELKATFDVMTAANEQGIANFIAERIDSHMRWSWQLKASLVPEGLEKAENESDEDFFVTVFSNLAEQGLIAAGGPSEEVRMKLAETGEALKDGSYPIRNVSELKKAIKAYGRSKPGDRAKVRRHIKKRASALKHPELVPEEWKNLSVSGMELSIAVADLRSRVKANSMTAAGAPDAVVKDAIDQIEGGVDPKALTPEQQKAKDVGNYTAKTQPRDAQGRFRLVLARLKQDLGTAELADVAQKVAQVENLDNAGNYAEAAQGARDVIETVNRIDTKALDATALSSVRLGATALAKAISNLPLPFANQSQKIRFSDVPPALANLIEDMMAKVEDKIGDEDAAVANEKLKSFMSGSDVFSQGEISSEMNKLLRLLT